MAKKTRRTAATKKTAKKATRRRRICKDPIGHIAAQPVNLNFVYMSTASTAVDTDTVEHLIEEIMVAIVRRSNLSTTRHGQTLTLLRWCKARMEDNRTAESARAKTQVAGIPGLTEPDDNFDPSMQGGF